MTLVLTEIEEDDSDDFVTLTETEELEDSRLTDASLICSDGRDIEEDD